MNKKILVIDDDPDILDALQFMLEDEGYEVVVSDRGEEALQLTKLVDPDLLLIDVLLSGMDGRDVCRSIKSQDDFKNLPIIMISAHPSAEKSVEKSGLADFVPKPFDVEELLEKISKKI